MRAQQSKAYDAITFGGYHSFTASDTKNGDPDEPYGSFEVFYVQDNDQPRLRALAKPGWYWWACFPGCSPDGEPNGPFPTAEGAYLDAIGD